MVQSTSKVQLSMDCVMKLKTKPDEEGSNDALI